MSSGQKSSDVYIALFRGINVGGKNILPMKALITLFEQAGCGDAETYIQSGNVVFRASRERAARLPTTIQKAVAARFGFTTPVVLRTAGELATVARRNPFLESGVDPKELHVMFLADTPTPVRARGLDPKRSPPDAFELRGREIYLRCPNGLARTKLTNAYFDHKLATLSTVRNWRTVLKLALMSGAA